MKRHLFNFGAAVSLLLCVATVTLWVRSVNWGDEIAVRAGNHVFRVRYVAGMLWLYHARFSVNSDLDTYDAPLFRTFPRSQFNTRFSNGDP